GCAVVLVGALSDRLAEVEGPGNVVVRHVGGSVADPVDAVSLLVDLPEGLPVAQSGDPLPERAGTFGEGLHQDAVHATRDAPGLADAEDLGHVPRGRVGRLAQFVGLVVTTRETALQRFE